MDRDQIIPDKRAILSRHEFFRGVRLEVIDRLGSHARQVTYPAGGQIFAKGDEGHGLLAVLSGVVRISVPSPDGKEILVNLIGPNEIFGEVALIDRHPRTADAVALTKCQLLVLDRRDFLPVMMEEPTLATRLLEVLSARLRRTTQQVEDISFGNLSSRLAGMLIRLAEMQGTISDPSPEIRITQNALGQLIWVSRETTNHYLQEWRRAGYLDLKKGSCFIHDKKRLNLIASVS